VKKNRLKFLKNQLVWFGFGFISLKPKKPNRTEPKPKKTRKKTSQTRKQLSQTKKPSQAGKKLSQIEKTESKQFEPVSVLF
jgi:hypothetical protein